ncbi:MAG: nucleoside deaminase [Pseudomonadota bacterium]
MGISCSRRQFMRTATAGSVLAACGHQARAHDGDAIVQSAIPGASAFIDRAFEMRQLAVGKGDQPYGAVIVREDSIVGQSWSRVVLDQDPTAHAEVAAIRDAARRLGSRHLNGTVMYSSSRPCPMCEAAAYWAGIDGMIYGKDANDAGVPRLCR